MRFKKNRINTLEIDGQMSNNLEDIQTHMLTYYKDLLGTADNKYASLDKKIMRSCR